VPNGVVFEKLLQVLVFGCAYRRIADDACSASTLRRRRDEWIDFGVMDLLWRIALDAYDRLIGPELSDVVVDGCTTEAPCGGERAGGSPVDRGKQGTERSTVVDAGGLPLGAIAAPANPRHDSPLLGEALNALEASGSLPERMIACTWGPRLRLEGHSREARGSGPERRDRREGQAGSATMGVTVTPIGRPGAAAVVS
jgi:hypothetical protein